MCGRPLVGLVDDPESHEIDQDHAESGQRHGQRDDGARFLEQRVVHRGPSRVDLSQLRQDCPRYVVSKVPAGAI